MRAKLINCTPRTHPILHIVLKYIYMNDKQITETNLLTLLNNVYLMFYAKEVDLGT